MSTELKNRTEVTKILRDTIVSGLTALGQTGWDVMMFAQASFQNADKIILLNNINSVRVGWQSTKFSTVSNQLKRTDEWIEEQTWQVNIILKQPTNAPLSSSTVLAEDVAAMLTAWLNGRGMDALRQNGIAPLRIDTNSIFVYNDDSFLYQRRAVFTVKLQVPKEMTTGEIEIDTLVPTVEPI